MFPPNAVQPLADATMLQINVIALFFGFGVIIAGEKGKLAGSIVESLSEISIKVMGIIIKFYPIGVFGLCECHGT
ncbi:MAG: dicarboxylate/amino acid:cation symporter [[Clostridium] scindens]|nr:cation:dicarboxylase symporter family transporter [[Clostridium] scindens]MCI6395335.1 dicarboxylate/amino acid:cation symporter [[Clostridium] scindens]